MPQGPYNFAISLVSAKDVIIPDQNLSKSPFEIRYGHIIAERSVEAMMT